MAGKLEIENKKISLHAKCNLTLALLEVQLRIYIIDGALCVFDYMLDCVIHSSQGTCLMSKRISTHQSKHLG